MCREAISRSLFKFKKKTLPIPIKIVEIRAVKLSKTQVGANFKQLLLILDEITHSFTNMFVEKLQILLTRTLSTLGYNLLNKTSTLPDKIAEYELSNFRKHGFDAI